MIYDTIIIGGGAAGLLAAVSAAEEKRKVVILEKMNRTGLKLSITGKGRCNLTNVAPIEEFISHFGKNGRFLRQALNSFTPDDLVRFLSSNGVETVVERGGRVFPASQQADDVVKALRKCVSDRGFEIVKDCAVTGIKAERESVTGVTVIKTSRSGADRESVQTTIHGKTVIVSTGGKSYPGTGSTGDGYELAKSTGHRVTPVYPALVPLVTREKIPGDLKGLLLKNVSARLWIDGKKAAEEFGELEFAPYGLTGAIVLTISRTAVIALERNASVQLSIDLKPALDEKKLDARLLREFNAPGKRRFDTILKTLLPMKMVSYCISQTGISPDKPADQVNAGERKNLRNWLKDVRFTIIDHRSFNHAVVTAGGVDIRDIDPRTMQSRIVQGLFFAGEVIDIDADTGGYNLQAAFSTGWLAGISASKLVAAN